MEFVGTAMEDDIFNGDASRVLKEVVEDEEVVAALVVNALCIQTSHIILGIVLLLQFVKTRI